VHSFRTAARGAAPQALTNNVDPISVITGSPPTTAGTAAANMGVENVSNVVGLLQITDFRRTADNMHAEYIQGTISAGGYGPNEESVSLTGMFDAPVCAEE